LTRQYIKPGRGPVRLRSLICSLIHSTHIGIKPPRVQAHASGCCRGCGRPPPATRNNRTPAAITVAASTGSPDGVSPVPSPRRHTASPAPRPSPVWRPAPRSGRRPTRHASPPLAPAGSDPSAAASPRCGTAHTRRTRHHTGRPGAAPSPALVHPENEAAPAARRPSARSRRPVK